MIEFIIILIITILGNIIASKILENQYIIPKIPFIVKEKFQRFIFIIKIIITKKLTKDKGKYSRYGWFYYNDSKYKEFDNYKKNDCITIDLFGNKERRYSDISQNIFPNIKNIFNLIGFCELKKIDNEFFIFEEDQFDNEIKIVKKLILKSILLEPYIKILNIITFKKLK